MPFRSGEVVLREEDSRGQGRIDPIETFSHGQLVKRLIDSKGSGKLDALYLFKDGRLIRDTAREDWVHLCNFLWRISKSYLLGTRGYLLASR